jgi:hypothetical protein
MRYTRLKPGVNEKESVCKKENAAQHSLTIAPWLRNERHLA